MKVLKIAKDYIIKGFSGTSFVPRGLVDLSDYFRHNHSIHFSYERKDNVIIVRSTNFRFGTIITSGKTQDEVDRNIKDAILTAFEVPSSYAKEAKIVSAREREYALA